MSTRMQMGIVLEEKTGEKAEINSSAKAKEGR